MTLLVGCASKPPALHGMQIDAPQPAPNFTLTDQSGNPFSLSQARGKAVALYFGFTHCADVCPQTLALLGKARAAAHLEAAQASIVMVSVDPRRDSPVELREFFRKVGVRAIGLTGSAAKLAPVYRAYGVAIEPEKHDIAHTDAIFLIDPQGRLRETLPPETPLKDIAADLRAVVE